MANSCAGIDGEFREDASRVFCADAVEGFEAVLGSVSVGIVRGGGDGNEGWSNEAW